MVLVAVGDIDIKEVFKDVANMFDRPAKRGPKFREEFKPSQVDPRIKLDIRDIDQAHLFVGVYGYGYNDSRRFGLAALTNILGQGMSSRLYKALRVKKGYSYAPEALYYPMIGIGELMMGGGFKQDKAVESVKIILEELSKLKKSGVSGAELEQTKKYLIGSIDLDQDDLSDINEYYGSQELLYKNQLDFKDLKAKIESVSKEQLKQIANEIFLNSRINLSVVGPYQGKRKEFERVFKFK
jgi:predicted Zn-dependent peptidase